MSEENKATPEELAAGVPLTEDGRLLAKEMREVAQQQEDTAKQLAAVTKLLEAYKAEQEKVRPIENKQHKPTYHKTVKEIAEDPNPEDEWEVETSETMAVANLTHRTLQIGAAAGRCDYSGNVLDLKIGRKVERLLRYKSDNWDTLTDTAGGDTTVGTQDWVQVMYSSTPADAYALSSPIAGLFVGANRVNIPQGTGSFRVPVSTSETTCDVVAERQTVSTSYLVATTGPDTDYHPA
jgi:hypothetical protein